MIDENATLASVTTRPIPGHDGYFADVFGRIWSTYRGRWGKTYAPFHVLKTRPDPDGYLTVRLWVPGAGKMKGYHAHVLIAAAFLGPRPEGQQVCHYNGIKTDIALANLMYGTPAENSKQAIGHGTVARGERQHLARLTAASARDIRCRRQTGEPLASLASEFGVSVATISAVATGRTWRHLTAVSA